MTIRALPGSFSESLRVNRSQLGARMMGFRSRVQLGPVNQWYEAFILLNFIDIILTLYFVRHGGEEANPVGAYIVANYGWPPFIAFKFLQCMVVVLIVGFLYHRRRIIGRLLITFGCLAYLILMIWDCVLLVSLHH